MGIKLLFFSELSMIAYQIEQNFWVEKILPRENCGVLGRCEEGLGRINFSAIHGHVVCAIKWQEE